MSNRLNNKVAFISGAGNGMGAQEAITLSREGAKVILADKDFVAVQTIANKISRDGGKAIAVDLDVTDESNWIESINLAINSYSNIDILVNNAGIYNRKTVENTSLQEFNEIIQVNLTGTFLGAKHIIPVMRARGGGSIINISSTAGLVGSSTGGAYGSSKGAIKLITKYIAVQHAHEGIRANSLHPGPIDTNMIAAHISTPKGLKSSVDKIPLGRIGSVEDVAMAVVFLASNESSFMTGSELVIDGGLTSI
jgi:NAD(P)-dependent dehydrogenase (short-subunit alcohol dehydrogenase family)